MAGLFTFRFYAPGQKQRLDSLRWLEAVVATYYSLLDFKVMDFLFYIYVDVTS